MATAKLFKNGRSQAVRIPAEFRFSGTEVEIERGPDGTVHLCEKPPVLADPIAEKFSLKNMTWSQFFEEVKKEPIEEGFEIPPRTAMPRPVALEIDRKLDE
jgi:antitoxin VapB